MHRYGMKQGSAEHQGRESVDETRWNEIVSSGTRLHPCIHFLDKLSRSGLREAGASSVWRRAKSRLQKVDFYFLFFCSQVNAPSFTLPQSHFTQLKMAPLSKINKMLTPPPKGGAMATDILGGKCSS